MSEVKRWNVESAQGEFVKYEDYAELKVQRDALATENAQLKELYRQSVKELDDTCFEIGMMRGEKSMEYSAPENPATDAYLNSVRAESIESFAHHQRVIADATPEHGCQRHRRFAAGLAEDFAEQLRAGEPS